MSYQFEQTINSKLLKKELKAVLGYPVTVAITGGAGEITRRGDSGGFSPTEESLIATALAAHNADALTDAQQLEQDVVVRRAAAKARLIATGAEGVRVTGLPVLADIVADIVEALDLDL